MPPSQHVSSTGGEGGIKRDFELKQQQNNKNLHYKLLKLQTRIQIDYLISSWNSLLSTVQKI